MRQRDSHVVPRGHHVASNSEEGGAFRAEHKGAEAELRTPLERLPLGEVSEAAGGPGCLELLAWVRTVLSLLRIVGCSQGALNWRIV